MNRAWLVILAFFVVAVPAVEIACSATPKQDVQTAVNIADAVCSQIPAQDDPAWVAFLCSSVNPVGNVVNTFTMKVPKGSLDAMAQQHCALSVVPDAGK